MANSVDPDETARYELSHLDLHCFQSYLYWSVGMKGLTLGLRPARGWGFYPKRTCSFKIKFMDATMPCRKVCANLTSVNQTALDAQFST